MLCSPKYRTAVWSILSNFACAAHAVIGMPLFRAGEWNPRNAHFPPTVGGRKSARRRRFIGLFPPTTRLSKSFDSRRRIGLPPFALRRLGRSGILQDRNARVHRGSSGNTTSQALENPANCWIGSQVHRSLMRVRIQKKIGWPEFYTRTGSCQVNETKSDQSFLSFDRSTKPGISAGRLIHTSVGGPLRIGMRCPKRTGFASNAAAIVRRRTSRCCSTRPSCTAAGGSMLMPEW